jgi:hypothetical protein
MWLVVINYTIQYYLLSELSKMSLTFDGVEIVRDGRHFFPGRERIRIHHIQTHWAEQVLTVCHQH